MKFFSRAGVGRLAFALGRALEHLLLLEELGRGREALQVESRRWYDPCCDSSSLQVGDQSPELLERVRLHEDVVFGQKEGGDFRELPNGGRVGVGDDGAKFVEGVVQVVHSSSLPGVDVQADVLALPVLRFAWGVTVVAPSLLRSKNFRYVLMGIINDFHATLVICMKT